MIEDICITCSSCGQYHSIYSACKINQIGSYEQHMKVIKQIASTTEATYRLFPNGEPVIVSQPVKPQPSPRPDGWEPTATDRPFMLKHLGYTGQLKYSNETVNARHDDNAATGKINVPLGRRPEWQAQIEAMNNYRILELFISQAFGFCDSGSTPEGGRIPYVTQEIPYGCSIDIGGNRRNCIEIILKAGSRYAVFETQNWTGQPDTNINYENAPHLTTKQVDASNPTHPGHPFWRTSEAGDVIWPLVSNVKLSHRLIDIHFYPGYQDINSPFQPFQCSLFGYMVRVIGYCFTGSETWVLVDGGELDYGWYQADGHNVPADRVEPTPGNDRDYFMNIAGVSWPWLTPPIADWRKE